MVNELSPSPREEAATVINLPMHNQAVYDSRRSSRYSDESQYSPPPTPSTPSGAPKSPLRFSKAFFGPLTPLPHNARTTVLAKQLHDYELSFADASRLLRGKRTGVGKISFTVLSPTDNDGFRKREVDPYDEESMASALCMGSDHYYMTRTNGKRLRLTSRSTILEEARSGWLNAVISASQQQPEELIYQLENQEDPDLEL
jgi:hypothetical protein